MKKKSIVFSSVSVLSILLAGCGGGTSEQTSSKSGDSSVTTLRWATWDTGSQLKIQQDIAKKFETSHPGVKVQVESYGDGFDQKLAASFGAHNPPDVMYMWNFPAYYQSLEPLDDYIAKDSNGQKMMDDFYPGLLNYDKFQGKLYGLPGGFTTRVIYYNKKLFDDAGVPYPKEGWTWDDFINDAKKLTKADQKQYGFGVNSNPGSYGIQEFVWSNGGSFISSDGKKLSGFMDSNETTQAIQMFGDMVKDKEAVLVGGKNQQSGDDIFKSGKIAMWESGIWPLQSFKDAGVNVGTVVLPSFGGKPVKGVIHEAGVSIAKDSKHKDLAWEYLKFFVSADAQKMRTGDLPVSQSVAQQLQKDQDPLIHPFYLMVQKSTDTPAFLLNTKWNEVDKNLGDAINAVMLGQSSAKDALKQVVQTSESQLQQ